LGADLVVIDERLARHHTKRLGLTLTGTLGVLLRAKYAGLVPSIAPLVEQLLRGGIRLGDSVVAEALRLAGEL
jgi:predicted nucleic acid-binding protein